MHRSLRLLEWHVMKIIDERLYESAKSGKMRKGKNDLLRHLRGERISQKHAIAAKCYDCNGMGEQYTCDLESCSLFPYSPYKIIARSARRASAVR